MVDYHQKRPKENVTRKQSNWSKHVINKHLPFEFKMAQCKQDATNRSKVRGFTKVVCFRCFENTEPDSVFNNVDLPDFEGEIIYTNRPRSNHIEFYKTGQYDIRAFLAKDCFNGLFKNKVIRSARLVRNIVEHENVRFPPQIERPDIGDTLVVICTGVYPGGSYNVLLGAGTSGLTRDPLEMFPVTKVSSGTVYSLSGEKRWNVGHQVEFPKGCTGRTCIVVGLNPENYTIKPQNQTASLERRLPILLHWTATDDGKEDKFLECTQNEYGSVNSMQRASDKPITWRGCS